MASVIVPAFALSTKLEVSKTRQSSLKNKTRKTCSRASIGEIAVTESELNKFACDRKPSADMSTTDARNRKISSTSNSSSRNVSPAHSPRGQVVLSTHSERLTPSPSLSRKHSLGVHNKTRRPSASRRHSVRLDSRSVSPSFRGHTREEHLRQPVAAKSSSARSLNSGSSLSVDCGDSSADESSKLTPRSISPAEICKFFGIDRGSLPIASDAFQTALNEIENDYETIKIKVTCES